MTEKTKKIVAWIGIVALLGLYVATLISALLTSPATPELFKVCIGASIIIPIFLYGYILLYKYMNRNK